MCCRRAVVDQHISVVIKNLGIQDRFRVCSAVCDGSESGCHLDILDTVCNTAESKRLDHVVIGQGRDAEILFQIFIAFSRSDDFSECLYGAGVERKFDGVTHGCCTDIFVIPVVNDLSAFVFVRFVFNRAGKCDLALIDPGTVSGQDLEAGTRLFGRVCRTVQGQVAGFLTAAADQRFYIAGRLVHDYERYLRLQGDRIILIHCIAGFGVDIQCGFVGLDRSDRVVF